MTSELKLALTLSVGLHVGVLVGLPFATSSVQFDVERAPTSLEVILAAPTRASVVVQPQPSLRPAEEPPDSSLVTPRPPDPVTHTVIASERKGALTNLLPAYRRNPAPVYPRLARERGYQGTVLVEAEVLPSGHCGQLRVRRSSDYAILDEAALDAVRRWQFKPATRGMRPVTSWVEIPITFRLIDAPGS